ncbi:MAG: hypothetical protein ACYS1A_19055 [Planctomycetota bacterium]
MTDEEDEQGLRKKALRPAPGPWPGAPLRSRKTSSGAVIVITEIFIAPTCVLCETGAGVAG